MAETSDNKGRAGKSAAEDYQNLIDELREEFYFFKKRNPQPTRWYFLGIDHDIDHLRTEGLNHKVAGATSLAAKGTVLVMVGRMAYAGIKAWLSTDAAEAVEAVEDAVSDLSQAA